MPRYEPHDGTGCGIFVFCFVILSLVGGIGYFGETKPHKEFIKNKTEPILDDVHTRAVTDADTILLTEYLDINRKAVCKDSVRLTKKMYKVMNKVYGRAEYMSKCKNVSSAKKLRNNCTNPKVIYLFDITKAMKNPDFKETYDQYYKTIKMLEISRRQKESR